MYLCVHNCSTFFVENLILIKRKKRNAGGFRAVSFKSQENEDVRRGGK